MGCYVNHDGMSKEGWLELHGSEVQKKDVNFSEIFKKGMLPVVLVDNGPFTAAGVAYCEDEWKVFSDETDDPRPRRYYLVSIKDLLKASDLEHYQKYMGG